MIQVMFMLLLILLIRVIVEDQAVLVMEMMILYLLNITLQALFNGNALLVERCMNVVVIH